MIFSAKHGCRTRLARRHVSGEVITERIYRLIR